MDYKVQLKLQALLDGELPEAEASEVTDRLDRDREAAALLEELRNTRAALAGFETEVRLPESREFFWSKVEREIRRLEAPAPRAAPVPLLTWFRRLLVPASAVAVVFIVGLVLTRPTPPAGPAAGTEIETAQADAAAFTYHDYSAGTTLVWLSYPADSEAPVNNDMGIVN
jgi:anti-sigma factor RsiW